MRLVWAVVAVLLIAVGVLGWQVHELRGHDQPTSSTYSRDSIRTAFEQVIDRLNALDDRVTSLDHTSTLNPGKVQQLEQDLDCLRSSVSDAAAGLIPRRC